MNSLYLENSIIGSLFRFFSHYSGFVNFRDSVTFSSARLR